MNALASLNPRNFVGDLVSQFHREGERTARAEADGSAQARTPVTPAAGTGPIAPVVAEISQLARAFARSAFESGATDSSFDLHFELKQLGVSIDGRDRRAAEGRELSVDLRIEAHRGTIETDAGSVSFASLDISFRLQESTFEYRQGVPLAEQAATPPMLLPPGPPNIGPADGRPNPPGRTLLDALKQLVAILGDAEGDLSKLTTEEKSTLNEVLQKVGRALESLGAPKSEAGPPSAIQFEGYHAEASVEIRALTFTRPRAAAASEEAA